MENWKNIKIDGIAAIEKRVASFKIYQLRLIPSLFFEVQITENSNGFFIGVTDIGLNSAIDESVDFGCGCGDTIEKALEFTLNNFIKMINERNDVTPDSFTWLDEYWARK
ncbi:hypothetical protein [Clostridium tagluense]|uniref:hypothetical protein n=1 Tax=Clostridium tagluense TaxID=360422 RepID=UPI001C6E7804|nr:hypothetical protein [Clostridium tagluense]MBW9159568.1 hypothetical protein [Clostridium tagluense]WLC68254.1 hypothetical protein KTC93_25055 [Clostridium tagluense]